MTYGVFNLSSGNLIDSVSTEIEALELLSSLLDERDTDAETIGLLVSDDEGHTVINLHGDTLARAVYSGGIGAAIYA